MTTMPTYLQEYATEKRNDKDFIKIYQNKDELLTFKDGSSIPIKKGQFVLYSDKMAVDELICVPVEQPKGKRKFVKMDGEQAQTVCYSAEYNKGIPNQDHQEKFGKQYAVLTKGEEVVCNDCAFKSAGCKFFYDWEVYVISLGKKMTLRLGGSAMDAIDVWRKALSEDMKQIGKTGYAAAFTRIIKITATPEKKGTVEYYKPVIEVDAFTPQDIVSIITAEPDL